jgi:hypothetical protein
MWVFSCPTGEEVAVARAEQALCESNQKAEHQFVLTQTPREISAPASARAFAIAQPKPCGTKLCLTHVSNECTPTAAAWVRVTSANACLIVSDASNEGLLACRQTCIVRKKACCI